jgi:hypothetical protein
MSRRIRKKKSSPLETRLEGYAQAAGSLLRVVKKGGARKLVPMTTAAGAALAMAPAADASIVYSGTANYPLPDGSSNIAYLNLDNAGTGSTATDATLAVFPASGPTNANMLAFYTSQGIFTTGGPNVANFSSGAQIGPSYSNIVDGSTSLGVPVSRRLLNFYGTVGIAGVRFNIGGQDHYAWIRLDVALDGSSLTIVDWAYEDAPGTRISAGAVPEPGSGGLVGLGLLALGARGVRHRRKRLAELERASEAPGS